LGNLPSAILWTWRVDFYFCTKFRSKFSETRCVVQRNSAYHQRRCECFHTSLGLCSGVCSTCGECGNSELSRILISLTTIQAYWINMSARFDTCGCHFIKIITDLLSISRHLVSLNCVPFPQIRKVLLSILLAEIDYSVIFCVFTNHSKPIRKYAVNRPPPLTSTFPLIRNSDYLPA
jgi:hypothetical protein